MNVWKRVGWSSECSGSPARNSWRCGRSLRKRWETCSPSTGGDVEGPPRSRRRALGPGRGGKTLLARQVCSATDSPIR